MFNIFMFHYTRMSSTNGHKSKRAVYNELLSKLYNLLKLVAIKNFRGARKKNSQKPIGDWKKMKTELMEVC